MFFKMNGIDTFLFLFWNVLVFIRGKFLEFPLVVLANVFKFCFCIICVAFSVTFNRRDCSCLFEFNCSNSQVKYKLLQSLLDKFIGKLSTWDSLAFKTVVSSTPGYEFDKADMFAMLFETFVPFSFSVCWKLKNFSDLFIGSSICHLILGITGVRKFLVVL